MSALDLAPLELPKDSARELAAAALTTTGGAAIEIPPAVKAAIRRELARYFWRMYIARRGETLFKRKVFIFSLTVTWRDARPVFVALFGEPPLEMAPEAK